MNLKQWKKLKRAYSVTMFNNLFIILLSICLMVSVIYNSYLYKKLDNIIDTNKTEVLEILEERLPMDSVSLKEAISLIPPKNVNLD